MILIKESQGLLIEIAVGAASRRYDTLTVKLGSGLSATPFAFTVAEGRDGRLVVHPAEPRPLSELVLALGVILANEGNILAEVRKYAGYVAR